MDYYIKGIKIVETDNYWFVDSRYNIRPINIIIYPISIGFLLIFFGNLFLGMPIWFIGLATIPILYQLIYFIFWNNGLLTHVYKKEWVEVTRDSNKLTLDVNLPKYSKDFLWKLKYGNKLLDFIGITVSSGEVNIECSFEINNP